MPLSTTLSEPITFCCEESPRSRESPQARHKNILKCQLEREAPGRNLLSLVGKVQADVAKDSEHRDELRWSHKGSFSRSEGLQPGD